MSSRPLILLTNDDGIRSPGLLAAAEAVCDLGELLIAAPVTQQTGMGRSTPPIANRAVTRERVTVACREITAYSLTASPAQAVSYAVLVLAPRRPDLVISGINYGENPGTCVTASGTVGAALQAAEFGIPALAVSLETDKRYHYHHGHDVDWRVAGRVTREIAQAVLATQLPFDVDVLKIDVPADATAETPWRITRQSRQPYYRLFRPEGVEADPQSGWVHLDYGVSIDWERLEPDSDIAAFARDRVISVTPLSHDMTSRVDFHVLEQLLRGNT
ncbi:MAG: 5'/3'-nucleotidase SurE [Anaerolineae bacterium]